MIIIQVHKSHNHNLVAVSYSRCLIMIASMQCLGTVCIVCVFYWEIWQFSSTGITIHPVSIITTEVRPAVEAGSSELHTEPSTAVSPLLTVEVYMCDDSDDSWHGDLDVVGMCFWYISWWQAEESESVFLAEWRAHALLPCSVVFCSCNSNSRV